MKVGDKVTIKAGNRYDRGDYHLMPISKPGQEAYITELLGHGAQLALDPDRNPDEHSGVSLFFGFSEFDVVKEEGFKVGDRVRLTMKGVRKWVMPYNDQCDENSDNPIFEDGVIYELVEEDSLSYDMDFRFRVKWDNGTGNSYMEGDIENA